MKNSYVKKGLAIVVIVLFVCVGISSAVAIKGVKLNNNDDVINFSNVESKEDLPDLIVVDITSYIWWDDCITDVKIKNIGNAPINDNVTIIMHIYRGIGMSSILIDTVGPYQIKMNIAPGGEELKDFYYDYPYSRFLKFVVHINYDKKVIERNYHNNLAMQRYYNGLFNSYIWIKIGPITYSFLFPRQIGI